MSGGGEGRLAVVLPPSLSVITVRLGGGGGDVRVEIGCGCDVRVGIGCGNSKLASSQYAEYDWWAHS